MKLSIKIASEIVNISLEIKRRMRGPRLHTAFIDKILTASEMRNCSKMIKINISIWWNLNIVRISRAVLLKTGN